MRLKYGYKADRKLYKAEKDNDWAWWSVFGMLIIMVGLIVYKMLYG